MQIKSERLSKKRSFLSGLKIVFPIVFGMMLVFASQCWCQTYGDRNVQQRSHERKKIHRQGRGAQTYGERHTQQKHEQKNIRRSDQSIQTNRPDKPRVRHKPTYGNTQRLRKNEKQWKKL